MPTFAPGFITGNPERDSHNQAQAHVKSILTSEYKVDIIENNPNQLTHGIHFRANGKGVDFRINQTNDQKWTKGDPHSLQTRITLEVYNDHVQKTDGWLFYSRADVLMVYLAKLDVLLQFPMKALQEGMRNAIKSGRAKRENERSDPKLYVWNISRKVRYYKDNTPYRSMAWMVELYEILHWDNMVCVFYDLSKKATEPGAVGRLDPDKLQPPANLDIAAYITNRKEGLGYDPLNDMSNVPVVNGVSNSVPGGKMRQTSMFDSLPTRGDEGGDGNGDGKKAAATVTAPAANTPAKNGQAATDPVFRLTNEREQLRLMAAEILAHQNTLVQPAKTPEQVVLQEAPAAPKPPVAPAVTQEKQPQRYTVDGYEHDQLIKAIFNGPDGTPIPIGENGLPIEKLNTPLKSMNGPALLTAVRNGDIRTRAKLKRTAKQASNYDLLFEAGLLVATPYKKGCYIITAPERLVKTV